jgi:hypothetical protein
MARTSVLLSLGMLLGLPGTHVAAAAENCAAIRQLSGDNGHPFADVRVQLNPRRGVILHYKGKPVFAQPFWSCDLDGPDAEEAQAIAEGADPQGALKCTYIARDRADAEAQMDAMAALFARCAGLTAPVDRTEDRSDRYALTRLARLEAERSGKGGTVTIAMDVTGFPGGGSEIPAGSPWVPERFWFSLTIEYDGEPPEDEKDAQE